LYWHKIKKSTDQRPAIGRNGGGVERHACLRQDVVIDALQ
jgi:hypothetical protein